MHNIDPTNVSVPALAYLGDSIIEVYVRERLVLSGISHAGQLNEASHNFVTARAQAQAFLRIEQALSEDESDVFHRGRNSSHINNVPKNAKMSEYRIATGMETLFGWLYLNKKHTRINELLSLAYPE